MTATNDWPGKPGVPLNPEKDGWHFWYNHYGIAKGSPREWLSGIGRWRLSDGSLATPEEVAIWPRIYLGPCLTPDEVQNLRDDLASAERERAHQHGRADRSAAEHAREQAKRESLQKRVAELEGALRNIEADCGSDCPPSHGAIKYAARAALGEKDE